MRACYAKNTQGNILYNSKPLILMSGAFPYCLGSKARLMALAVESTSAKNVTSEIYTGAPLEHARHAKKNFL